MHVPAAVSSADCLPSLHTTRMLVGCILDIDSAAQEENVKFTVMRCDRSSSDLVR